MMEVSAKGKYIRRTPRKARLVAALVQGMRVAEALAALEFSPKHAATDVAKVIKSAAANAEHNFNLTREELWVKQLLVDEGPTMKRIRPVSPGMAHQYFHRTCHIAAVVEDRPEVEAARPAPRRRLAAAPKRTTAEVEAEPDTKAAAVPETKKSRSKAEPEPEVSAGAPAPVAAPEEEAPAGLATPAIEEAAPDAPAEIAEAAEPAADEGTEEKK